jgi:hypothetical protein
MAVALFCCLNSTHYCGRSRDLATLEREREGNFQAKWKDNTGQAAVRRDTSISAACSDCRDAKLCTTRNRRIAYQSSFKGAIKSYMTRRRQFSTGYELELRIVKCITTVLVHFLIFLLMLSTASSYFPLRTGCCCTISCSTHITNFPFTPLCGVIYMLQ